MMDDQKILIEGLEEAAICELDIGRSRLFECIAKIVKELVELRKANAELEAVVEDLISNSSFSINFPIEHDKLEKLRGK